MAIEGSSALFPNNIVLVLADNLEFLDNPDTPVLKRRLYSTDPVSCIGVTAFMWTPDQSSYEMRGPAYAGVPTISRYDVTVQCMIRDMEEERGLRKHAELTKRVQKFIMGDATLRGSLHALTSSLYGINERLKKWHIENSRYLAEEVSGEFIYLSTSTVRLETET
jgi:hypothetical protein